jgi:hypothetical protein
MIRRRTDDLPRFAHLLAEMNQAPRRWADRVVDAVFLGLAALAFIAGAWAFLAASFAIPELADLLQ